MSQQRVKYGATLLVATMGMGITGLHWSAVNTLLPVLQQSLHASLSQLQWMMNSYGIVVCCSLVVCGNTADRYGRKRIFMLGIIAALVAALLALSAQNPWWIITSQVFAGIGAAALMPVSQALLAHAYPKSQLNRAMGVWATGVGLCLTFGPLIAGSLAHSIGWRVLFALLALLNILSLVLAMFFVEESRLTGHIAKNNYSGAGCIVLLMGSLVLGLDQMSTWNNKIIAMLFCVAIVVSYVFYRLEQEAEQPILGPKFFKNKGFLMASLVNFCLFLCLWAVFFLVPLFLHKVLHLSIFRVGIMMLALSAPAAIFSFVCMRVYCFWGPRKLAILGFVCLFLSMLLLLHWHAHASLLLQLAAVISFGFSWCMIWSPSNIAGLASLPAEQAGLAAGSFISVQELGGTLGLAVMVSVVRHSHSFMQGFRMAAWVMLGISVLGMMCAICMPRYEY